MVRMRVMLMDFPKASVKEMTMASLMVVLRVMERLKALSTELMMEFLMDWPKALLWAQVTGPMWGFLTECLLAPP